MIDPPPLNPRTIAMLKQTRDALDEIAVVVPESFEDNLRSDLIVVFSSVAYEHTEAILLLSQHRGTFGSAMALFRPLLETIIRGEWLCFCADEKTREDFAAGNFRLDSSPFKRMSPAIDLHTKVARFAMYEPFYSHMCDYTHTGHDAIARRSYPHDAATERQSGEPQIRALLYQAASAIVMHYEVICSEFGDRAAFDKLGQLFYRLVEH